MDKFLKDKGQALAQRMLQLGIAEKDIVETFVASSGPGGQNVNKTATCVQLHHIPTNIIVKCQKERSQAMNRYWARQLLIQKIDEQRMKLLWEEKQRIYKLKRKKRKKPKSVKEQILEMKRKRSEKKAFRKKVNFQKLDE